MRRTRLREGLAVYQTGRHLCRDSDPHSAIVMHCKGPSVTDGSLDLIPVRSGKKPLNPAILRVLWSTFPLE